MNIKTSTHWKLALALTAAAALTACGGGDDKNPLGIDTVKVVGDSLSDSGTFAGLPGMPRTFTVQASADDERNVIWVERIAKAYDVKPLCPAYKFNGQAFAPNSQMGCTNYAVGGANINNLPSADNGKPQPPTMAEQLSVAAAAGWRDKDLLLIDGGGNDAADLIQSYIGAAAGQEGAAAYVADLATLVPTGVLHQVLAGPDGAENAGGLYMQALADSMTSSIRTQAVAKGAKQVLVANIPDITFTPDFQAVLAQIEQAAGTERRAQAQGLFKTWIRTYNARLAANFKDEARVKVYDLESSFTSMMTNPAKHGLTNVSVPVCGAAYVPVLPVRNFAECTADALSATPPPPGASGTGWWQRFMFADGFHPTPYGHKLFADPVINLLDEIDWL